MKLLKIFPLEKDPKDETFLNWKCFQEALVGMTNTSEPKTMIYLERIQS
jgi:hypothetical protein